MNAAAVESTEVVRAEFGPAKRFLIIEAEGLTELIDRVTEESMLVLNRAIAFKLGAAVLESEGYAQGEVDRCASGEVF